MVANIVRRLLAPMPVLLFVSIIVFSLIHLLPGDPAISMLGEDARPQLVEALRRELGLDQPPLSPVRHVAPEVPFRRFRQGLSRTSSEWPRPFFERLPVTIELTFLSFLVSVMIALPLAIKERHSSLIRG